MNISRPRWWEASGNSFSGNIPGKKALEHVMASLGCECTDKQVCRVLDLVKDHSEHKCNITPDILRKLIKKAQQENG